METQVCLYLLTGSLTELEAEYNTLVGIASDAELSIFYDSFFKPVRSNCTSIGLVYLDGLGLINALHISFHPYHSLPLFAP